MAFDKNNYYRLDYIENTASAYLNLNMTVPINLQIDVDCAVSSSASLSTENPIIGISNNTADAYRVEIFRQTVKPLKLFSGRVSGGGTTKTTTKELEADERFSFTYVQDSTSQSLTVDGETVSNTFASSERTRLYVFSYYGGSRTYGRYKVYSVKVSSEGVTLRDLVPAMRKSDGVIGMYDVANDVFYTNVGSGTFARGNIIYDVNAETNPADKGNVTGTGEYAEGSTATLTAVPNLGYGFKEWEIDDYILLDYIESSGTQYIDTKISGLTQMNDLKVVSDVMWTGAINDNCLLGVRLTSGNSRRYMIYAYPSKWCFSLGASNYSTDAITINQKYHVEAQYLSGNSYLKVDDEVLTSLTNTPTDTGDHNLTMFAMNRYGTISYYASARVYSMTLYEASTGNVLRNFIPVKKVSTGEVGLLDTENLKFYGNDGTGVFSYGNEIGPLEWTSTDNPLSFVVNDDISFIANLERTANCRFKVNGTWKMGMMYKKINGAWKLGQTRVKVNGTWKNGA